MSTSVLVRGHCVSGKKSHPNHTLVCGTQEASSIGREQRGAFLKGSMVPDWVSLVLA